MNTTHTAHEDKTQGTSKRHNRWVRAALVLGIVGAVLLAMRAFQWDHAIVDLKRWIAGLGPCAPVVLAILYVVATVLMVPGTILTLIAGALFGPSVGMVCVSIGSTVGASLAFIIARYLARDRIATFAGRYPRFDAIDRAIGEGGWKVVALLRLSPAIPFNVQNYLYGLTRIRFWPYAITSWLAMMPGTFLYVYLGHITGAALAKDRDRTFAEWSMLGLGLLATIAVTVLITRLTGRQLQDRTGVSE